LAGWQGRGCRAGGAGQLRRAVRAGSRAGGDQLPGRGRLRCRRAGARRARDRVRRTGCRRPFPQITAEAARAKVDSGRPAG